jgi:hypothetical protein
MAMAMATAGPSRRSAVRCRGGLLATAVVLLLPGLSSCGGDTPGGSGDSPPFGWGPGAEPRFPRASYGILGAWFPCRTSECKRLDEPGIILREDGSFRFLSSPGSSLEPGESFCETTPTGTFEWDGQVLELAAIAVATGLSYHMDVTVPATLVDLDRLWMDWTAFYQDAPATFWVRVGNKDAGPCFNVGDSMPDY